MGKPFLKKILVAINGTHSSVPAAMYGIILAKQYQLKMKVVFVVDTATIKYLINFKFLVSDEKDAYKNDLKKDGQNYLDYVVNLARTKGVKIEPELREGSVSSEVITAADEFGSDLILVGGHNDPGSYIQGNQTKKSSAVTVRNEIVNYAHCPVLVVHKQDVEELFKIS